MTVQTHPAEDDDLWAEASDNESWPDYLARGGALSVIGRRAAIAAALPLLGTYFASGQQPLLIQPAISRGGSGYDGLEALSVGLRVRAALALGTRLVSALTAISHRPTFRYRLEQMETTGEIAGQLDIGRLLTRAPVIEEPQRYPVNTVQRAQTTPENTLAVYAARWVLKELACSTQTAVIPIDGPERRSANDVAFRLGRLLRLPGLAACDPAAATVARLARERHLLQHVKRRLRRREVSNPAPYRELCSLIGAALTGDVAAVAGDIDWSFYGEAFDSKLYEVWCLAKLAEAISCQLAVPTPLADLSGRSVGPVFRWRRPAGVLELHFQRSLSTVSQQQAQWKRQGSNARLGGVPDFVCRAVTHDGTTRLAVLDAKLRQRTGPPAEEIYKILGYVENFGLTADPHGVVLYHSTSPNPAEALVYERSGAGTMLAVALNPAGGHTNDPALQKVASLLLGLLGIPPLAETEEVGTFQSGTQEDQAHLQTRARVRELLAYADTLPHGSLDAYRRRMAAQLGDRDWSELRPEVQTILATSEHVGFSLAGDEDFSGPVLGLCASVEFVLFDRLIDPLKAAYPDAGRYCKTLGQAIAALQSAIEGNAAEVYETFRRQIEAAHYEIPLALVQALERANRDYRIPAAHRSVVGQRQWLDCWEAMVRADGAPLRELLKALRAPTAGRDP